MRRIARWWSGLRIALALCAITMLASGSAAAQIDDLEPDTSHPPDPMPASGYASMIPTWHLVNAFPGPNPGSFDIDPATGHVYIANQDGITIRDITGRLVDEIAQGAGQVDGVLIASNELFLAEQTNDRVSVWTLDGTFKRSWGALGSGDGQFKDPCDIAISPTNEFYVVDTYNRRVQVFDIDGVYQRQWGSYGSENGEFDFGCPRAEIVIHNGEVYVTDYHNDRVQVFDTSGTYLRQWGSFGSPDSRVNGPAGIDIVDGLVYVSDFSNNRIQVFNTAGTFQGTIPVTEPVALKVDPSGTVLLVGDSTSTGGEVRVFSTLTCDGLTPTAVGTSFNDRLVGTAGADIVHLNDGHDRYRARGGDDTVCGGNGNDDIRGGGGADHLDGGSGIDDIRGQGGTDDILGRDGPDKLDGNGAADLIRGGNGNDTINGQNGADVLRGGTAADTLKGQTGPDTIYGDDGNDDLFGGNGNDTLYGGTATDKCSGNLGPNDMAEAATCEQTPGVESLF